MILNANSGSCVTIINGLGNQIETACAKPGEQRPNAQFLKEIAKEIVQNGGFEDGAGHSRRPRFLWHHRNDPVPRPRGTIAGGIASVASPAAGPVGSQAMPSLTVTILAILFAVLTLASSASAECAWVLWQETRPDMLAPGLRPEDPVMFIHGNSTWKIHEVRPTQAACEESKWDLRKYVSREQTPIMKNKKIVGEWSVTLQCLPDTIDPRGPKGSGR